MAIGDTLNQNPFGTDYNAEEEERKKAELEALNARIGSGDQSFRGATGIQDIAGMQGVPQGGTLDPTQGARDLLIGRQFNRGGPVRISDMGSLIQEPGTSAFSMEAAGQVNPMMQQQNLESFAQPQVTFRDYDVPATPPASALSVFTPGSEVKPNVDVNAITPSPEITSDSAVNTALNQEVAVGLPSIESSEESVRLARSRRPRTGESSQNVVLDFLSGTDYGGTRTGRGRARRDDNITTQAPSGLSDLAATSSITPPVGTPSGGAQGQTAALDPTSDEAILARRAEREAQFAPTNGLTTVGGASLSEFLSGQAMPEQGFTQEESPLGGRGVTLTQDQMNQLSAEREARLDARLPGDQSVSDRDRRAARGDGISMADQVDMAKANARGATPREVARGNQVANALGLDLKTGQPPEGTGGLTESELQRRREFAYKQEQDILAGEKKAKETEGERSVNRAKAVGSLQALKADLDLIKETGEEVRTLTLKPRTEGLLAKALATVSPTSTAAQLERASGVLTGDAFIKGMQVIKAFGGGLGSVTEVEGLKVERAQGAIFENGMGDEERRQAVKDYIQVRENAYNRIREAFVKEYGETDAQTYLGTQNTNATAGKAIPNDRNVSVEVSPELEQYFN